MSFQLTPERTSFSLSNELKGANIKGRTTDALFSEKLISVDIRIGLCLNKCFPKERLKLLVCSRVSMCANS